jgi:hypothetical protein
MKSVLSILLISCSGGAGGHQAERMGRLRRLWSISRSRNTEELWEFDILSGFYVPKQWWERTLRNE